MSDFFLILCGISLLISLLYVSLLVYIWKATGSGVSDKKEGHEAESTISVIIACRNEEKKLPGLLKSLSKQQYPSRLFEIIIVDDHSEDNSLQILFQWKADHPQWQIIILQLQHEQGKKAALTLGIKTAHMEYILCCDADSFMGEHWMLSMIRWAVSHQYSLVLGPVCVLADHSLLQQFQLIETSCLQSVTAGSALRGKAVMANGANLIFRKLDYLSIKESLSLTSFESGDDIALLHGIKKNFGGKAIGYASDHRALVSTFAEDAFTDFFWQHVRWASKSKGYRDADTSFLAAVTAFENILIIILSIITCFYGSMAWILGFTLGIKGLAEYQLIRKAEKISQQKARRIAYILSALLYPFFTAIVLVASIGRTYRWKGRLVK